MEKLLEFFKSNNGYAKMKDIKNSSFQNYELKDNNFRLLHVKVKRGSIVSVIDSRERDAKVYKVYSTKKGDKIKINLLSIANDNLLLFIKYKDENGQNHSYREDVVGTKFLSLNGKTIFSIPDKNPQKYKKDIFKELTDSSYHITKE